MCTAVEHPNVFMRHDMHRPVLDVSELDEVGFECQDPRIAERKANGCTFPINAPFWSCSPSVTVDEEGELRVVEQEFAIETLNVDGLDVLLARDEVKGSIGLIEQGLRLESLK